MVRVKRPISALISEVPHQTIIEELALCRQVSLPDGSLGTCRYVSGRDTRHHTDNESTGFRVIQGLG